MKRIMVLLIIALFVICNVSLAEDTSVNGTTVVNMQYTVHFDTYEREGLYSGDLKDGIPEGFGVFVTHNASGMEWHYIGQWSNGQFNGEGAQYWEIGQVCKGHFEANKLKNGYVRWVSNLLTMWLDEFDTDGNQHFVSYYPDSMEQKYCEGYANVDKREVVSVVWFDRTGNEVELPESLIITAISYISD